MAENTIHIDKLLKDSKVFQELKKEVESLKEENLALRLKCDKLLNDNFTLRRIIDSK